MDERYTSQVAYKTLAVMASKRPDSMSFGKVMRVPGAHGDDQRTFHIMYLDIFRTISITI
jgi:hypothetical protein